MIEKKLFVIDAPAILDFSETEFVPQCFLYTPLQNLPIGRYNNYRTRS